MAKDSLKYTTLKLSSAEGPVYRKIKISPPRNARRDEIPIIDVGGLFSTVLEVRRAVAESIHEVRKNVLPSLYIMPRSGHMFRSMPGKQNKLRYHQPLSRLSDKQETKQANTISRQQQTTDSSTSKITGSHHPS